MNLEKFLSHTEPDFLLREHLKDVAEKSGELIESLPLKWDKQWLKEVAYIIGLCHDFAKYTTFFQRHLREGERSEKSRHSFLSAIFTAWALKGETNHPEGRYIPLIAFFLVLHHHTNLTYPEDDIPPPSYLEGPPQFLKARNEPHPHRIRLSNAWQQVEDIKENALEEVKAFYEEEGFLPIDDFLRDGWLNTIRELYALWRKFQEDETEEEKQRLFWLLLILYSTLLDCDKKSAGRVSTPRRRYIPSNLVELYKRDTFKAKAPHPLDGLRESIYSSAVNRIEDVPLDERLFSLTAPTGSGKTLTALACSLRLRERIEREKGYSPRIIYALPYINIIEQNYQVFRDVLSQYLPDFEQNEHSYIISHHHLAEAVYRDEEEERKPEEAYHLISAWDSEIVVTTFIQLFYSIIGYDNGFLRKFHNIVGDIILLDEGQSVPVEYWEVIGRVLSSLAQYLDCYIVLLTATQPFILPEEEKIELVENPKENFKGLNRVTLHFSEEEKGKEDVINWLSKAYQPLFSYLLVVNTIPSSIELYRKLREVLRPSQLFYLSTNIVPKQRRKRIEKIKELLESGEKPFLVSTQVVEAGVDLDFDIAIRDIGPIDSLVQIAGRCNREGEKARGDFFLFHLGGEASRVYRHIHISTTLELLREKVGRSGEIKEEEFMELVELFFQKIKNKVSTVESKRIWEAILDLRFSCEETTSLHNFELIKEDIPETEIFVEMDDKASEVWEQFLALKEEKDLSKRRERFLRIRKDFYDYVIAVPKERAEKNPPPSYGNFLFIPKEQQEKFYSQETGFKWEREMTR